MRALIFEGPNRLSLRDWPCPRPAAGEVLIRVRSATICGTDVRIVTGRKTREVRAGHPLGHECAGVVSVVGEGVQTTAPGDCVGLCPVVSCGECEYCLADRENLCEKRYTLGYATDGAFAEYMLIPAHAVRRGNLFKLPDHVPLEVAAVLEPLGCCINGQREMGLEEMLALPGADGRQKRLVIFGAGPIGLLHLLLARAGRMPGPQNLSGPPALQGGKAGWHVTVVEPRAHRRAMALRMGADEARSPEQFAASGEFDAAILAVGVPELVHVALRAVRRQGRVSLFAGFDAGSTVSLDPNLIHYGQIRVTGASESRRRDFAEGLALTAGGRIDLGPLVTDRFPLTGYEAAFRAAGDGSALKVAFAF